MTQVNVSDHQLMYGTTREEHNAIQTHMTTVLESLNTDFDKIDVYHLRGVAHEYRAGSPTRFVIFVNGVKKEGNSGQVSEYEHFELFTHPLHGARFLSPVGTGVLIESNGIPVAEYHPDQNELCILFDLFKTNSSSRRNIFTNIMQEFKRLVLAPREMRHSWVHSQEKAKLTERFVSRFKAQREDQINEDKRRIREYEENIHDYKRRIKQTYDNLLQRRRQVETEEQNLIDVQGKLIGDLDLVVKNPKVSDLHIRDGKFIVYTPNIYAYSDQGNRYYIGNMHMELQLENASVKFFGDNPRRGFWGNDPHPHVNGSNGNPCLGSIASTVAELCSRNEIYALVLTCIDFLENANTSDPAGKKIIMWDEVDDDGTIIREGGEEREADWYCDNCEEGYVDNDEQYCVYREGYLDVDGDPVLNGEHYVGDCCISDYTWYDELDAYVYDRLEDECEDDDDEF